MEEDVRAAGRRSVPDAHVEALEHRGDAPLDGIRGLGGKPGRVLPGGVDEVAREGGHRGYAEVFENGRVDGEEAGEQAKLPPRAREAGEGAVAASPGVGVVRRGLRLPAEQEVRLRGRRDGPVVALLRVAPALGADADHLARQPGGPRAVAHDHAEAGRVDARPGAVAAIERAEVQLARLGEVRVIGRPAALDQPHLLVHAPEDPDRLLVEVAALHHAREQRAGGLQEAALDQRQAVALGDEGVVGEAAQRVLQDVVREHGLAEGVGDLGEAEVEPGVGGPQRLVPQPPQLVHRRRGPRARLDDVALELPTLCVLLRHGARRPCSAPAPTIPLRGKAARRPRQAPPRSSARVPKAASDGAGPPGAGLYMNINIYYRMRCLRGTIHEAAHRRGGRRRGHRRRPGPEAQRDRRDHRARARPVRLVRELRAAVLRLARHRAPLEAAAPDPRGLREPLRGEGARRYRGAGDRPGRGGACARAVPRASPGSRTTASSSPRGVPR